MRTELKYSSNGKNGHTSICVDKENVSETSGSSTSLPLPKDIQKLVVSVVLLFSAALVNDLVLAYIHERVPETPPLPDLIFSRTPHLSWALVASEYLMVIAGIFMLLVCCLHKYRCILFRRVCFISSLLYFGRSVCMLVTQVPVADPAYYCSPKLKNTSCWVILTRAFHLMTGVGLKINGKHTFCGDYIFSGHTLVLIMSYLVIREYSPKKWWVLHWTAWGLSACGIVLLLLSRAHYTVDVVIAYWITTRTFWIYHTLATSQQLKTLHTNGF